MVFAVFNVSYTNHRFTYIVFSITITVRWKYILNFHKLRQYYVKAERWSPAVSK